MADTARFGTLEHVLPSDLNTADVLGNEPTGGGGDSAA